jgi:hypothetical protein
VEVQRRQYSRHRDARVALIRCSECLEYYETSVRQARRIRNGENRRLCPFCRNLEGMLPDRTEEFVRWWLEESGIPRPELLVLAKRLHPEEARQAERQVLPIAPVPSPSRRLPLEEGNRPTPLLVAASIRLSFGSAVSTAA